MGYTCFVCKNCNKELTRNSRENAERLNWAICVNCYFFELIDVWTIADYNAWLKKGN